MMNVNQDFAGRVSDVGVFGNYAYLDAFNERDCQKGGVYVFDISDPTSPKQINFIRAANNSYVGEGVQVLHFDTPQYNGDVLVQNNEICGPANTGAKGGLSLIDVTNPKVHTYLAEGVGDFDPVRVNAAGIADQIHSAFVWDAAPYNNLYNPTALSYNARSQRIVIDTVTQVFSGRRKRLGHGFPAVLVSDTDI